MVTVPSDRGPGAPQKDARPRTFWMTAATVLLAFLCVAVGVFFSLTLKTWIQPAAGVLAEGVQTVIRSWGL